MINLCSKLNIFICNVVHVCSFLKRNNLQNYFKLCSTIPAIMREESQSLVTSMSLKLIVNAAWNQLPHNDGTHEAMPGFLEERQLLV